MSSAQRLRWRCRRGMRELDLLLLDYLERVYPAADETRRSAFEALLDQEDPTLWRWLLGAEAAPAGALGAVIDELRHCRTDGYPGAAR